MPPAVEVVPDAPPEKAFNDLARFHVERVYVELGCNAWDARKVMLLMAKFGDTRDVMAARLRHRLVDFERRMNTDQWTKQDGLILTFLQREIDIIRGGIPPKQSIAHPAAL